ncbi:MAG: hypothetical protein U0P81_13540 [Holophagaceae bacterium]
MKQSTEQAPATPQRPLARVHAHVLTTDEIAKVSGGWTFGLSNAGGVGDKDLVK